MSKTIIVTEDISMPIDEGIKKFSFHLAKFFLSENTNNKVFSASANSDLPAIEPLPNNKLLFSLSFFNKVRTQKAQNLIYIPSSSSTLMSFLRLRLISLFSGPKKIIMVSVQERKHGAIARKLISILKPTQIVVLSNKQSAYYGALGIDSKVSPIGVDTNKFRDVTREQKEILRKKLGLPLEGKIVLHVGHINKGRNIGILRALVKDGYHVVIIGSTRFESDNAYKAELEKDGYIFINHYIEKIEEYYQASDIYVFPVQQATSAMEFPLSVLEAMACNIPVVTTNFGGLINFLSETEWFRYFQDEKELSEKIISLPEGPDCGNRKNVIEKFTWDQIFKATFQ